MELEEQLQNSVSTIISLYEEEKTKDVLILGCGPSFADFTDEDLIRISENKVVFAIKQAQSRLPDLIDYHFLNDNNLQDYFYPEKTKIVVEGPQGFPKFLSDVADFLFVINNNSDFSKSLSSTHDFDAWTLNNSPLFRPWGPGIMYETVLFFAEHIGAKNIYTIGWDLGPPGDNTRKHFYNTPVRNKAFAMGKDETEREVALTKAFYEWLDSKEVNLYIASDNSYAHEDIPRVSL